MRRLGVLLALAVLGTATWAGAQAPGGLRRVGILGLGETPQWQAFRQALRERGYAEGRTVVFEHRWVGERPERAPGLAAELVALKVDVIVSGTTPLTRAAKEATGAIPIVMVGVGDPVEYGLVQSLARPGGNLTGFSTMSSDPVGPAGNAASPQAGGAPDATDLSP